MKNLLLQILLGSSCELFYAALSSCQDSCTIILGSTRSGIIMIRNDSVLVIESNDHDDELQDQIYLMKSYPKLRSFVTGTR